MSEAINENAEGYNTVVENREGGGGAVGWSYFYGLDGEPGNLVKAESAINTLPLQEGVEVPWTYEDFTPIALFGEDSRMIVAPADSDLDTCADLASTTDLAIGNSGTYGADGMAIHHLEQAGMQANKVPYGSTGEVMTALLGDQIEAAPASAASAKPYVESGDLKALCTFSEERFDDDVLGNVETAEEQGIDGTVVLWRGVLAPPNISEAAQEFWIQEFQKATETDVYHEHRGPAHRVAAYGGFNAYLTSTTRRSGSTPMTINESDSDVRQASQCPRVVWSHLRLGRWASPSRSSTNSFVMATRWGRPAAQWPRSSSSWACTDAPGDPGRLVLRGDSGVMRPASSRPARGSSCRSVSSSWPSCWCLSWG